MPLPLRNHTAWAIIVGLGAWVVLASGLTAAGIWTAAELPVVDRARAALGEPLSVLVRSPWFPDAVRTLATAWLGPVWGARLPHALAVASLAGASFWLTRRAGGSMTIGVLAAVFCLAFPVNASAGRTALGNPIGESMAVLSVIFGLVATADAQSPALWRRAVAAAACVACLGLSVASTGIVLGAGIPLAVLALAIGLRQRRVALALALAAGLALGIGIELVWDQQEGYIPLLGAAKDLDLVGRPEQRRFASVLQEFAHQTFPWAGLVVLGSTRRGFGWVASWLVVCLLVIGGWSLVYGAQPGLMSVPAAVCCAAGCEQLVQTRSAAFRRVGMIIAIGAMLVLAKDGERVPSRVVVPTFDLEGEHRFPADQLDAPDRIERLAKLAALAVLIAGCTVRVGHRRSGERSLRFVPPAAATAIVASTAVMGVWTFAHGLVPEAAAAFSPKQAIERFSAWVDAGALEEPLGTHRVDDAGFALLEMPALVGHKTREDAITMLAERERAAVLVRDADLAYVFRSMRQRELPMYVVFDGHATYRLLSNVLPKGAVDRNPILDVLRSEAPPLRHETLVRFEEFVEIIAWEFSREPIVRGSETTITVALRVLKPLPAGSKIYLRLLKDRLVHVNPEPHDFVGRVFPCNMWRPGDVIVHTFDLEMPWLETIPGEYEFVVGVQRSQRKNLTISVPQEPVGEYGVELRGSKRSFATVGRVQVW